jgi:hypothetical protein
VKLSSAMILGMQALRLSPGDINFDILGVAANAVGISRAGDSGDSIQARYEGLLDQWPWLARQIPVEGKDFYRTLLMEISYRFDQQVCGGEITLNDLLVYVRSLEPECGKCCNYDCACERAERLLQSIENELNSTGEDMEVLRVPIENEAVHDKQAAQCELLEDSGAVDARVDGGVDDALDQFCTVHQITWSEMDARYCFRNPRAAIGNLRIWMKEWMFIAIYKAKRNWKDYVLTCLVFATFASAILAVIDGGMGGKYPAFLYIFAAGGITMSAILVGSILWLFVLIVRALLSSEPWTGDVFMGRSKKAFVMHNLLSAGSVLALYALYRLLEWFLSARQT